MVRKRMTGKERREQLIEIGRSVFSERGFEGTSVEEIAARAGVSKPVVYEHFGGKEGLYAVVVDREMLRLEKAITDSMQTGRSRARIEQAVLGLLTYVEEDTDGFQILVRDMKAGQARSYSTLLNDAVVQVSYILEQAFERSKLDPNNAVLYAQALVGMVSMTAQWWLDQKEELGGPTKEEVAAHIVNLCWNGLAGMESEPSLSEIGNKPETLGSH
ncbi:TetR/AcrR family transcriptional regulator [Corynebacterium pseudotuberculosis]|uniref:TetR family transcriptional regulator n=1 Tax=Corynebacterium pseudotuberculosis 258 TaxID=1168865 RepID=A0AAU8PWX6_CORPS|nr:TetR/AcrR family transcriptional regulator [Corynebacterium pseudotuberculosis]AER68773.1 TetR family transcriptional regulator [Corynebacterium pseudotuberculosis 1/06-A]AEQ06267.1 TetR family transcriptional regulator [Corynebacterium pseudotuberculosis CIP 52.97]AFB72044.1 TetR family transcriptional regulator [Corynebacterium pseudotuberculosis 316]AFH90535.1 TetR family transcriptional regulator [Corynebacterium pseudotuberculosis 31]AFK16351.1 TetR family transcriptional regulator [Co